MGRAIRCSNDMADRMETDKDIREMSLFDYFFFYARINTRDEILEPPNFEASKLFIIKLFVTRNSGEEGNLHNDKLNL